MSGFTNALVICAVVVLVVVRQFKPQQISTDRSWWVIPAVLIFMSVREPDLIDPGHEASSVALLAVELLVGLAMGVGWARTSHVWTERDGTAWSKGTKATAVVWGVGIGLRAALFGVGELLHVRQGSAALMLALAATLLVRSGLLLLRTRTTTGMGIGGAAGHSTYGVGDAAYEPMRKDPV
ncbi:MULTISPECIES: DUF1453 domain-containing protein [Streptomyces]|uniref:DUF1453 domain-containing protein n=1 Tax=Streptomyces TaxID=1883 RepID=UPI0006EB5DA3|nr:MULTISPECIES: DUF1453 domain-containing protein [Streptomyces]